jgi:hypothetical protein
VSNRCEHDWPGSGCKECFPPSPIDERNTGGSLLKQPRTDGWRDDAILTGGIKLVLEGNLTSGTHPFSVVRLDRLGNIMSEQKFKTREQAALVFDGHAEAVGVERQISADLGPGQDPVDLERVLDKWVPGRTDPLAGGGNVDYYLADVKHPKRPGVKPYVGECEDISHALEMTPEEFCEFKAIWRTAAARLGCVKAGMSAVRDAEKRVHYATLSLTHERQKVADINADASRN